MAVGVVWFSADGLYLKTKSNSHFVYAFYHVIYASDSNLTCISLSTANLKYWHAMLIVESYSGLQYM